MEIQFSGVGSGGVTDHGALRGLGDDDHRQYVLRYGDPTGQEVYGGTEPNQMLLLGGTYREEATEKGIVALDENTPLRLSRIDGMHVPPAHSGPGALDDIEGGLIYVPFADPDPTAAQGAVYYSDGVRWILLEGQAVDTTAPAPPTGIDLNTGTLPDERSWIDIAWLPNGEDDLVGYIVFRKDEAADEYHSISYVYADPSAVEPPHYTDYAVITNEDYWYGLAAYDKWGNVSEISEAEQNPINAGDKTRPPDVTGEDGVALGNTAVITWIDPTGVEDLWKIEIWRHDTADANYLSRWGSSTLVGEVGPGVQRFTYVRSVADASVDTDRFYISAMDTAKNKSHPKPSTALAGYPPYVDVTFNNTVWSRGTLVTPDIQPNENGWWNTTVRLTIAPILTIDEQTAGITAVDYYYVEEDGTIQPMSGNSLAVSTETTGTIYTFFVEMSDGTYTAPSSYTVRIDKTPPPKVDNSWKIKQRGPSWVSMMWDEVVDPLSGTWGYNIYRSTTTSFPGSSGFVGFVTNNYFVDPTVPDSVTTNYWATAVDNAGNESDETDSYIWVVKRSPEFTVDINVETPPNENGWWNDDININLGMVNIGDYVDTDFRFDCRLTIADAFDVWNGAGYTSYSGIDTTAFQAAEQNSSSYELILTGESATSKGNTLNVLGRINESSGNIADEIFVISSKASMMRFKIDRTGPSIPTITSITAIQGGVALTWTNGADTLSGLWKTRIYRSTNNVDFSIIDTTTDENTTYYEDKSMVVGTTYYYKIANLDKAGNEGTLSTSSSSSGGVEPPTAGIALTESGPPTNGWFGSRFTITIDVEVPAGETVSKYCFVMAENGVVPAEGDYYEIDGNTVSTRDLRYGDDYGDNPNNSLSATECTPSEGRTFWAYVKYVSGVQSAKISKQYFIDVLAPSGPPTTTALWTIDGALVSWDPPSDYSVSGFDKGVVLRNIGIGTTYVVYAITNSSSGTFLDGSAPENTEDVSYKVDWYNKAGNSTGGIAPNITTGSRNDSHVRLWLDPEPNPNGWNNSSVDVYWSMNTGGFTVAAWYYSINGAAWVNAGTATHVGVSTEGSNTVEVYASTSDGIHSPTASISFKIDSVGPSAPSITSLTQGEGDASSVTVVWTDGSDPSPASGIVLTEVWRSKSSTFSTSTASRVGIVPVISSVFWVPTWVDHTVENSTTYYYFVRHIDAADNEGTVSEEKHITVESAQIRANKNYLDNSSFERMRGDSTGLLINWEGSYTSSTASPSHGNKSITLYGGQGAIQKGIPIIRTIRDGKIPYYLFSIYARTVSGTDGVFITLTAYDVDGVVLTWGSGLQYCKFYSGAISSTMSRKYYLDSEALGRRWIIGPGDTSTYNYNGGSLVEQAGVLPAAVATIDVEIHTLKSGSSTIEVDAVMMEEVNWDGNQLENPSESEPSKYYDSRVINTDRINAVVGRFLQLSANRIEAGVLSSVNGNTRFDLNSNYIVLDNGAEETSYLNELGLRRTYHGSTQYGSTKISTEVGLPAAISPLTNEYVSIGGSLAFSSSSLHTAMGKILSCGATLVGKVVNSSTNAYDIYSRPIGHHIDDGNNKLIGNGSVEFSGAANVIGGFSSMAARARFYWPYDVGDVTALQSEDLYTDGVAVTGVPKFGVVTYPGSNGVQYNCSSWIVFWVEFAY